MRSRSRARSSLSWTRFAAPLSSSIDRDATLRLDRLDRSLSMAPHRSNLCWGHQLSRRGKAWRKRGNDHDYATADHHT
jgi:hypothetical protein